MIDIKAVALHISVPASIVALASSRYIATFTAKYLPVSSQAIYCTALIGTIHGLTLAFLNEKVNEKEKIKDRRLASAAVIILTTLAYTAINPLDRPKKQVWDLNLITFISGLIIGYCTEPKLKTKQEKRVEKFQKAYKEAEEDINKQEAEIQNHQATIETETESIKHYTLLLSKSCAPGGYLPLSEQMKSAKKRKLESEKKLKKLNAELPEKTEKLNEMKEELRRAKENIPGTDEELTKKTNELKLRESYLIKKAQEFKEAEKKINEKQEEIKETVKQAKTYLSQASKMKRKLQLASRRPINRVKKKANRIGQDNRTG